MNRYPAAPAARVGTIGTIALGAVLLAGGLAAAEPDEDEARERYEELQEEFSALESAYIEAEEDHDAALARLSRIEEDLEEAEADLADRGGQIKGIVNAAYTDGGYDPMTFAFAEEGGSERLAGVADLNYLADREQAELLGYLEDRERLESLRSEAEHTEEEAADALAEAEEAREAGEAAVEEQAELVERFEVETADGGEGAAAPASAEPAASGDVQGVLDYARAQIGKPYVWGGTGPDGFDCSGLTLRAWEQAGVTLPRVSQDQWNFGTRVDRSDLQPGDLLFFYSSSAPSHVGLYSGNGRMIHGSNPAKPIAEVELAGYWDGVFVGAARPA